MIPLAALDQLLTVKRPHTVKGHTRLVDWVVCGCHPARQRAASGFCLRCGGAVLTAMESKELDFHHDRDYVEEP